MTALGKEVEKFCVVAKRQEIRHRRASGSQGVIGGQVRTEEKESSSVYGDLLAPQLVYGDLLAH